MNNSATWFHHICWFAICCCRRRHRCNACYVTWTGLKRPTETPCHYCAITSKIPLQRWSMGWLWDGYSVHGRARQRNEIYIHPFIRPLMLRPAKAAGVDELRPLDKELGSGAERRDHDSDNGVPSQELQRHPRRNRRTAQNRAGLAAGRNVNSIRTAVYWDRIAYRNRGKPTSSAMVLSHPWELGWEILNGKPSRARHISL